ncbi:MAG: hypothetical protein R2734_01750 [Nocardioides sp.]
MTREPAHEPSPEGPTQTPARRAGWLARRQVHGPPRDDWVIAFRLDLVHPPGGEPGAAFPRLVLEHPGAVVVLAVDADERVLCLRQCRHALGGRYVRASGRAVRRTGEDHSRWPDASWWRRRTWRPGNGRLLTVRASPGVSTRSCTSTWPAG